MYCLVAAAVTGLVITVTAVAIRKGRGCVIDVVAAVVMAVVVVAIVVAAVVAAVVAGLVAGGNGSGDWRTRRMRDRQDAQLTGPRSTECTIDRC